MGIAFYGNYLTTGKLPPFLRKAPDLSMPSLDKFGNKVDEVFNSVTNSTSSNTDNNYIYKWQDENGQIHLTSEQPAEGIDFETVKLQNDVNVVPSVTTNSNEAGIIEEPDTNESNSALSLNNIYSPDKIKQLKQDAEAVRDQLNQRTDIQNELLND